MSSVNPASEGGDEGDDGAQGDEGEAPRLLLSLGLAYLRRAQEADPAAAVRRLDSLVGAALVAAASVATAAESIAGSLEDLGAAAREWAYQAEKKRREGGG